MAWQYVYGYYKNIAIKKGSEVIDDGSGLKRIAALFDNQRDVLLGNPYGAPAIPTHSSYRVGNAEWNAILAKDPGSFNLYAILANLNVGESLYLYNKERGESVNLEWYKYNASYIYMYSNMYGERIRIWEYSKPGGNHTWSFGPFNGFGIITNPTTQQASMFYTQQFAYQEPGDNVALLSVSSFYSLESTMRMRVSSIINAVFSDIAEEPSGGGPYDGGGTSTEGGGDPDEQNFDEESDTIGEPTLPGFSATGSGMVSAYVPTVSEMNNIADYLIDPNIIQVLAGTVLKLSDVVIGLNLFPFNVPANQSKAVTLNLMGARLSTGINCHYADNQFVSLDMGSIQIAKCWDNCLDYNPYTRISIFLPFCGYYELDTDEVMGKTVNVKYKIDIITGSCVALVIVDGSVMYQFAGQCASQIPVSSVSFDGMISSMIDLGMTVASAQAAVGGAAAAGEEAGQAFLNAKSDYGQIAAGERVQATHENLVNVKGAAGRQLMGATANAILSSKGFYSHAGGLSSAPGFLGCRTPFIIKKIPRQSVPEGYGKMRGYPSNIKSKLSDLSGYTEVEEIQLNIPNATVAEIAECERILKAGCYL